MVNGVRFQSEVVVLRFVIAWRIFPADLAFVDHPFDHVNLAGIAITTRVIKRIGERLDGYPLRINDTTPESALQVTLCFG